MSTIKTVSFSRLQDFEKCQHLAKLKYVERVPEPERPLPSGKKEHANDRGTRVHDAAELYVRGKVELISELEEFETDFDELKRLFAEGAVSLEGEWAVNRNWEPVAWASSDAWCRMKLDAMVRTSPTSARVIDYKTGKRYGNEVKHTEQGQVYQLATFLRFPELEHIVVEFWYTDLGEKDFKVYTRAQGTSYFDKYDARFASVTECTEFKPNPNAFSCKWCPYKGNACEYGLTGVPNNSAQARIKQSKREYTIR
jgi:hypothetical protein